MSSSWKKQSMKSVLRIISNLFLESVLVQRKKLLFYNRDVQYTYGFLFLSYCLETYAESILFNLFSTLLFLQLMQHKSTDHKEANFLKFLYLELREGYVVYALLLWRNKKKKAFFPTTEEAESLMTVTKCCLHLSQQCLSDEIINSQEFANTSILLLILTADKDHFHNTMNFNKTLGHVLERFEKTENSNGKRKLKCGLFLNLGRWSIVQRK